MDLDTVDTLMGILAVYCGFAKKGLLRGSGAVLPVEQQEAIDEFARTHGCEIYWAEKHGLHLWRRLENE